MPKLSTNAIRTLKDSYQLARYELHELSDNEFYHFMCGHLNAILYDLRNHPASLSTHSSPTAIRKPEERKNTRSTHFSTHSTQTEFLVNPFSRHLILGNRLKSDFDFIDPSVPFIHDCIGIVNLVCL